jgi:hypothetical protein
MRGKESAAAMKPCPRVTLEPELECEVGLFTPPERLELARKFERWARQLRVSAFILRRAQEPKRPAVLKVLPRRKLALN